MNSPILLKWLLPAGIAAAVAACGPSPQNISYSPVAAGPSFGTAPISPQESLYEWYDDGGPGQVSVRINISNQIATIRRGGREIGWSYVATGRSGHGTPAGSYSIQEKVADKYSNRWGSIKDSEGNVVNPSARVDEPRGPGERWVGAAMPYWMRLTSSGIGMHAGPIPTPGSPASAGCIRFPSGVASKLYHNVKIGTPVTIVH